MEYYMNKVAVWCCGGNGCGWQAADSAMSYNEGNGLF